jgi:hypothetical protein
MKTRDKVFLILLAVAIIALFSSWGRPLWPDEYLHFVFGGFNSVGEAWAAVQNSTTNINHGQTGFYMMLDFALLKIFGANLFAMRLPSLISAALLLFSVALFLRRKNLGAVAIGSSFLLLLAQPNLMYFTGEARPYMPMAASVMAALAYFSTDIATRHSLGMRILGWGSMIWGALMMPYYIVYLPVIAMTCFLMARIMKTRPAFLKFINLPLQIASVLLGVGIGALTWLRGSPDFDRDPWLIIRPLYDSITSSHILAVLIVAILILIAVWNGLINSPKRAELERLIMGGVLLILVAGGMAVVFATLSLSQSYWILPRQFVASQAIITVAVVWIVSAALRENPSRSRMVLTSIFILMITIAAARSTINQVNYLADWENNGYPIDGKPGDREFLKIDVGPANQNVLNGGPVSEIFTEIYDEPRYGVGEEPKQ